MVWFDAAAEQRGHRCRIGGEAWLVDELTRTLPNSAHRIRRPGLVESALDPEDAAATPSLAFATQALPAMQPIAAASVQAWAEAIGQGLVRGLADHAGPWRLHLFAVPAGAQGARRGRARLVEAAVMAWLRRRQRRLLRSLVADASLPWADGEALVQATLETATEGLLSIAPAPLRFRLRRCLSRFADAEVRIERDPRPPSRAYAKLLEAEIRLGRAIEAGHSCVDLGASPGGWTYVALDRGARVTAVDRSPLRSDLMRNARLTFVRGDAFGWVPREPVDWLLCDVIAFPERSIELVRRWLSARLCRHFVVTIKFRGRGDYVRLEVLKAVLEASGYEFQVRRLDHNKNEVTAYGEGA